MAVRKTAKKTVTPPKKTSGKSTSKGRKVSRGKLGPVPLSVVFGIFLLIVLIAAFFVFLPKVRNNVNVPPKPIAAEQPTPQETTASGQDPQLPTRPQKTEPVPKTPGSAAERTTVSEGSPPEPKPEIPVQQSPAEQPLSQPPATPASPATDRPVDATKPGETRSRCIYFMQAERGGADLSLVKTDRHLRISDSPLLDCLNALIAGPTTEERNRGFLNFVPPDTRIISALVRGNTAYLNFNEGFQYGTHGREGYTAQIKQIVWTATEFPNVHDVQILIEGKRVDFLSEGVMIGSPIGRQ